MKIAVLGAGAMGCMIGTFLIKSGAEVYFVDPFEAHMEAVQKNGLNITLQGADGPEVVHPRLATTYAEDVGICDAVILLVKGMQTSNAIRANQALFGKETIVITMQNGVGNTDLMEEVIPRENIGFGVLKCSATLVAPGQVFGNPKFPEAEAALYFYPIEPQTPYWVKYESLLDRFTASGFLAKLSPETEAIVWDKLCANALGNIPCALLQVAPQDFVTHEFGYIMYRNIVREVCEVATAKGIPMDFETYWTKSCVPMIPPTPVTFRSYTSAIHDVSRKHQTESDFLNGAVCRVGKKLGIPTPWNEAVWCLIKVLESNYDNRYIPES